MKWQLLVSPEAVKQLSKLDRPTAKLITSWLGKNVDGCENPGTHGKPLKGDLAGSWRYRIGNYRVLCELQDERLVVLAIEVPHRSEVYTKKTRARKKRIG